MSMIQLRDYNTNIEENQPRRISAAHMCIGVGEGTFGKLRGLGLPACTPI